MMLIALVLLARAPGAEPVVTAWGRIEIPDDRALKERRILRVEARPESGMLALPTPFANIVRAWVGGEGDERFLRWSFNKDATEVLVELPDVVGIEEVHLLTAETSGKQADGTLVMSALDAKVMGTKAALETHPGNHRIGFWVRGEDFVAWEMEFGVDAGRYEVELVYSRAGQPGAEVAVKVGEQVVPARLGTTGSWYVYQVQRIGAVDVGKEAKLSVEVRSTKQVGPVMNLKAVVLRPKPE